MRATGRVCAATCMRWLSLCLTPIARTLPRRLPTMTFMMSFPLLPATIILGATDPEGALQVASC